MWWVIQLLFCNAGEPSPENKPLTIASLFMYLLSKTSLNIPHINSFIIFEPNRNSCKKFLDDNKEILSKAYGAKHNHQNWEGSYLDHISEIMNIAHVLYEPLNSKRNLPFSLSDSLLVLFLHDLEKPWKYEFNEGKLEIKPEMKDRKFIKNFVYEKIKQYGFQLTEEHKNGIEYVEGEIDGYSPGKRSMLPLAAFCHLCDLWSARGWFDCPKKENDSWKK